MLPFSPLSESPAPHRPSEEDDLESFFEDDFEEAAPVDCSCRCGECCRRLLIEVDLDDAKREPKIAKLGLPVFDDNCGQSERELIGYIINKIGEKSIACVFLDETTSLCTIHETKPTGCRVFDCDAPETRSNLIELGILPHTDF